VEHVIFAERAIPFGVAELDGAGLDLGRAVGILVGGARFPVVLEALRGQPTEHRGSALDHVDDGLIDEPAVMPSAVASIDASLLPEGSLAA
jgi:hypothetical protein